MRGLAACIDLARMAIARESGRGLLGGMGWGDRFMVCEGMFIWCVRACGGRGGDVPWDANGCDCGCSSADQQSSLQHRTPLHV